MDDACCRALLGGSRHLGVPKVRPLSDSCSRWLIWGALKPSRAVHRPAPGTGLPSPPSSPERGHFPTRTTKPKMLGKAGKFMWVAGGKEIRAPGDGSGPLNGCFHKNGKQSQRESCKAKGGSWGDTGAGRTAPTALVGPWEPATKLSALHASGLGKQGSRRLSDPTHWQVSLGLVCFGILCPCL